MLISHPFVIHIKAFVFGRKWCQLLHSVYTMFCSGICDVWSGASVIHGMCLCYTIITHIDSHYVFYWLPNLSLISLVASMSETRTILQFQWRIKHTPDLFFLRLSSRPSLLAIWCFVHIPYTHISIHLCTVLYCIIWIKVTLVYRLFQPNHIRYHITSISSTLYRIRWMNTIPFVIRVIQHPCVKYVFWLFPAKLCFLIVFVVDSFIPWHTNTVFPIPIDCVDWRKDSSFSQIWWAEYDYCCNGDSFCHFCIGIKDNYWLSFDSVAEWQFIDILFGYHHIVSVFVSDMAHVLLVLSFYCDFQALLL